MATGVEGIDRATRTDKAKLRYTGRRRRARQSLEVAFGILTDKQLGRLYLNLLSGAPYCDFDYLDMYDEDSGCLHDTVICGCCPAVMANELYDAERLRKAFSLMPAAWSKIYNKMSRAVDTAILDDSGLYSYDAALIHASRQDLITVVESIMSDRQLI